MLSVHEVNDMFKEMKQNNGTKFYLPIPGYPTKGRPVVTVDSLFDSRLSEADFIKIFQDISDLLDVDEYTNHAACLLKEFTIRMPFHYDRYKLLINLLQNYLTKKF